MHQHNLSGTAYPKSKNTTTVFGGMGSFNKDNLGGLGGGGKAGFFSEVNSARAS